MKHKLFALLSLFIVLAVLLPVAEMRAVAGNQLSTAPIAHLAASDQIAAALRSAPAMFIENVGQFDERARFQMRAGDRTLWLAEDAIWVTVVERPRPSPCPPDSGHACSLSQRRDRRERVGERGEGLRGVNLRLTFPGANPHLRLEPFDRLSTRVSYFIGDDPAKWRTDVPVWGGVRYVDLYPGVDLVVGVGHATTQGLLQGSAFPWRLVARPGADLKAVRLRVEGADALVLDDDRLRVTTVSGEFSLPMLPVVAADGSPLAMRGEEPAVKGNEIATPFAAGTLAAVGGRSAVATATDTVGLFYATFLGGGGEEDWGGGIVVDEAGNAYVAGRTNSFSFPSTPGAFDPSLNGSDDAFVVKLNATGSALVYATFLGGKGSDGGTDIALDGARNAYVSGWTYSSEFPTTPGAFDPSHNRYFDAFVVKLNSTGSALVYATFLGGRDVDSGNAIAVDRAGDAYVTGWTKSSDFPTTPGALDTTLNGDGDAFVVKLNATGSTLTYVTFLGGSSNDSGGGIAVDGAGNAYVIGATSSSDFPTTPGAFDPSFNDGDWDAFVVKLDAAGSALAYATFLGGSSRDTGTDIAVDAPGDIYVTGWTDSSDFPTTPGASNPSFNGDEDAFVMKLNATGSALAYATFLGGSEGDEGLGIAVDVAGNTYVTGVTWSSNFPTTPGAFDPSHNGSGDAFVVQLNPTGSLLLYATFLGGSQLEYGESIAMDSAGDVYVVGQTYSSDFPTTPGAFDRSLSYENDAFVTKLAIVSPTTDDVDAWVWAPSLVGAPPAGVGTISIRYGNNGLTTATSVLLTATLGTGLTYISDTSGITPTVGDNRVTWNLPDLAFLSGGQFVLWVSIPDAPIGTRHPVTLAISSAGPEANSTDNTAHMEVMSALQVFLPVISRSR